MNAATDKTWSDKAVAKLKTLAAQELSASKIAEKLCEAGVYVSRNAVIGKCHRDGIALEQPIGSKPGARARAGASSPPVPPAARRPRAYVAKPVPAPPPVKARPARELVAGFLAFRQRQPLASGSVTLAAAGDRQCRRPVSRPGPQVLVCGARTAPRAPFCPDCARLTYVAGAKKLSTARDPGMLPPADSGEVPDLVDLIGEVS